MCGRLVPIAVQTFFLTLLRPHNSNPYVLFIYDYFHLWDTSPWSLLSFFSREEWKVTKEEAAGR